MKNQEFVFDREKLETHIEEYSDEYYFVYVEYEVRNLISGMILCEFCEDCEWWDFKVKEFQKNGVDGWLFSREEKKIAIRAHIIGFIYEYNFICNSK